MGGLFFDSEAIRGRALLPRRRRQKNVSVRDRDDAARREGTRSSGEPSRRHPRLAAWYENATAEPKRTHQKDLHGQPGPACIPQKGFMDTGWLHATTALAVALDRVFLDPR